MKKFLALALALVMALALAVPAMAFTAEGVAEDYVPTLSIELVEFENDDFFGLVGAAPSDRGYAKNEIVAFIVTLEVAKDEKIGDFDTLDISGENVTFDVNETNVDNVPDARALAEKEKAADGYTANVVGVEGKVKYQWLSFAKVTGDDASITATLYKADAKAAVKFNDKDQLVLEDEDEVEYTITASGSDFIVEWEDEDECSFTIKTGKKGVSEALFVEGYKVIENKAGEYVFLNAENGDIEPGVKADKALYEHLCAIVDDVFEGVFGFEYDLLGGVVNKKYFESLASYEVVEVTVDIAPWVAYVQVPDVIVVDPPKTGDATVLVGIVMAIVAAAGVVVFNKVRA